MVWVNRRGLFVRAWGRRRVVFVYRKKQARKQMNTVLPSDHMDYKINKGKAHEQDSTGTPRLAVSAEAGLGRLSVRPAAAAAAVSGDAAHRKQQPGYQAVKPAMHIEPEYAAQPELLVNLNLVTGPRTHNLADEVAAFVVMSL